MDAFHQVAARLPGWLRDRLGQLPPAVQNAVQELRLRTGQPVVYVTGGQARPDAGPALTRPQLEEILFFLCGGSVYAHEDELAQGFLSLSGGHRAGVGGSYVRLADGKIVLQTVQSVNIRLACTDRLTLPPALCRLAGQDFSTLLIGGEPGSGKTTLLRALAVYFSARGLQCTVLDERGEIFPPQLAGAACCDCIRGLAKPAAIQMALRTLAPQVLLLDELVSMEEIGLLMAGAHAGVKLVFTIHAGSMAQLLQKPQVQQLQACGMLDAVCLLAGRSQPGCVREVKRCCAARVQG